MLPHNETGGRFQNPYTTPLGKPQLGPQPVLREQSMPRNEYRPSMRPARPDLYHQAVQPQSTQVHDEIEKLTKIWNTDKENLYDQLEKLGLRLEIANGNVIATNNMLAAEKHIAAAQQATVHHIETQLADKQSLLEQYLNRVQNNSVELDERVRQIEDTLARSERFKKEIIRMSNHIDRLYNAIENAFDLEELRKKLSKLKDEDKINKKADRANKTKKKKSKNKKKAARS